MEHMYMALQDAINTHLVTQNITDVTHAFQIHEKGILDAAYSQMEDALEQADKITNVMSSILLVKCC